MLRIFRKLVPSILILCLFTSYAAFAQNDSSTILEAYGLNTIAGHTTYLRTSQTLVDASVVFEITDPLGDTTTLSAVSNSSGVAQAELSDYYTKHAGTYTVSARLENDFSVNNLNSFVVYPNAVSSAESVVTPGEQVVRSYGDEALVTVKLADDYGNVIEGHLVKLISSSNDDFIQLASDSDLTDANGEIVFDVSSDSPGIVTYTIYDVTADEILDSRAKVVYFDSTDYLFSSDLPNDFDYAALGNSSSGVDTFEFVDTPDSIDVGESVTFTLSANDSLDQVVTGYDGTVRFSVLSDNSLYVSLPDDFTFSTQDLGSHTFSLALSFQQEGTYSIEARDTENPAIYGEYEFVVGVGNGDSTGGLNITNPAAGTYSNNIQVVSGSAPAGSQLKIFDNDLEISTIIADASGVFSYTTTALTDGEHNLYVATINGVGTITGVSPTVTLTIDSSGPELSQVVLEPSGAVDPGTIVSVKLYTTDDLSQAAILFQDNIYEMAKGSGDFYEGSFAAPVEFGDYSVSFILIDQLGNEAKLEDQATVNVGGIVDQPDVLLGSVTDLEADPEDHRIVLSWKAPESSTYAIKNYRVYYGLSPNELTEAVDTFTNGTTWYIPNLKNGVEYYFAAIAVDEQGNISEVFSNIVASTPNPDVVDAPPPEVTNGSAGGDALDEMEKDVSESGPEIVWLVLFSLLGGFCYSVVSIRKEEY